jgi:hypothetical protein
MIAGAIPYNKFKYMFENGFPIPFHINDTTTAKLYILKDTNLCRLILMDKDGLNDLSDSKPIISKRSRGVEI